MESRFVFLLAAVFAFTGPALADPAESNESAAVPLKVVATKDALRDLWIGHVFWVRNVVDARLGNNTAQARASEQQVVAIELQLD